MSMQKTLDHRIKNYILSCIDSECYDIETATVQEKLDFLMKTFKTEYGFMIPRIGETPALKEWFMGLPSVFNCAFYNCDTYKLGLKLGFLKHDCNDKAVEKFNDHYWHLLATKTMQLSRNYRVDVQTKEKQNIRVFFDDHDNLITSINTTENGALKYYVGESFTKSDETKHVCTHIEFLTKGEK